MKFHILFKYFLIVFAVFGFCVSVGVWITGNGHLASFISLQSGILAISSNAIDLLSKRLESSIAKCKLSATQLARLHRTTAKSIQEHLIDSGYITNNTGIYCLSDLGRNAGGEWIKSHPKATDQEGYFVWPITLFSNI